MNTSLLVPMSLTKLSSRRVSFSRKVSLARSSATKASSRVARKRAHSGSRASSCASSASGRLTCSDGSMDSEQADSCAQPTPS